MTATRLDNGEVVNVDEPGALTLLLAGALGLLAARRVTKRDDRRDKSSTTSTHVMIMRSFLKSPCTGQDLMGS